MFAAAMLYSTPSLELSIYSTCKRISQKLMRNVTKFLELIYEEIKCQRMPVIRSNMEEVVLQGPEGIHDVRVVNSYPSKVRPHSFISLPTQVPHLHRLPLAQQPRSIRLLKLLRQVRLRVALQRLERLLLPPKPLEQ
jgi:hypothetical protein